MRIVFIGSVELSFYCLEKLVKLNANIVGVCTKKSSSFNSDFMDLTPICKENDILFKFVEDINSKANIKWIELLKPDIIFCFGWSNLIKKELLDLPPMGIIGYHPSLLPKNRGRHPLVWALVLGLEQTGSTFFFIDEGVDSGQILSQEIIKITYKDNARTLYNKMIETALLQIKNFMPKLQTKSFTKKIQTNNSFNIWRKRYKKDGLIDFRMTSYAIYNLVRALTKPYVGAHIEYNNENIIIWRVKEVFLTKKNIECGKILNIENNKILVKTQDTAIEILEHEFKKLPKVGEYL